MTKKKKRKSNRNEQALVARQRVHHPWPSFLDYDSDDDFYDWYSGEVVPSPEFIFTQEMKLIDKRAEEMIDEGYAGLSGLMFANRSG